ncbi:MAG: class I SAM-dependent methyltransferase [Promethearchaeota archaeon]
MNNAYLFEDPDVIQEFQAQYTTKQGKIIDYFSKLTLDRLLKDIPRGKFLEIDARSGHWSEYLGELGYDVTAIDSSKNIIQYAQNRNISFVNFKCADVLEYSFKKPENFPLIKKRKKLFERASNHRIKEQKMRESWKFRGLGILNSLEFLENPIKTIKHLRDFIQSDGFIIFRTILKESPLASALKTTKFYKNAEFRTLKEIKSLFTQFGFLQIDSCCFFTPEEIQNQSILELVNLEKIRKNEQKKSSLIFGRIDF